MLRGDAADKSFFDAAAAENSSEPELPWPHLALLLQGPALPGVHSRQPGRMAPSPIVTNTVALKVAFDG